MEEFNDENMHIQVVDPNGVEKDCEIIMTYQCMQNGIDYVFYTDNELDDDGELNIYASRLLNLSENGIEIGDIENDEEWDLLENVLEEARKGLES